MPRSDYCERLPLVEQFEKRVDRNHDPSARHISSDEAQVLHRAISRLKGNVPRRERVQSSMTTSRRARSPNIFSTYAAQRRLQPASRPSADQGHEAWPSARMELVSPGPGRMAAMGVLYRGDTGDSLVSATPMSIVCGVFAERRGRSCPVTREMGDRGLP